MSLSKCNKSFEPQHCYATESLTPSPKDKIIFTPLPKTFSLFHSQSSLSSAPPPPPPYSPQPFHCLVPSPTPCSHCVTQRYTLTHNNYMQKLCSLLCDYSPVRAGRWVAVIRVKATRTEHVRHREKGGNKVLTKCS